MVEVRVLSACSQGCLFNASRVVAFRQLKVQVSCQTGPCSWLLLCSWLLASAEGPNALNELLQDQKQAVTLTNSL